MGYTPNRRGLTSANVLDLPDDDWRSLPEVHVSDIIAFLACRRAWNWSSRLRGNLEPIRPYAPFVLGRAVHEASERLNAYGIAPLETVNTYFDSEVSVLVAAEPAFVAHEARNAVVETLGVGALAATTTDEEWLRDGAAVTSASLIASDLSKLEEQRELALGMLQHYQLWEKRQRGPFSMNNLEFLTIEQEFAVPIVNPVTGVYSTKACFSGKWDGLVRRIDNGDVFIWELKTTKSIGHRAKMLSNDIQCSMYLNAAKLAFPELAGQLRGMIYTLMGKRVPKSPRVLNDGYLSKDIRGQSLDSYIKFVEQHHQLRETMNDAERRRFVATHYAAPLAALADSTAPDNTFFERHIVSRNADALRNASIDLWELAENMTDPSLPLYPTPGYQCNYCLFYEPCIELQNGKNVSETLSSMFRKRVQHAGDSDADPDL